MRIAVAWKLDHLVTISEAEYDFWQDHELPYHCVLLTGIDDVPLTYINEIGTLFKDKYYKEIYEEVWGKDIN